MGRGRRIEWLTVVMASLGVVGLAAVAIHQDHASGVKGTEPWWLPALIVVGGIGIAVGTIGLVSDLAPARVIGRSVLSGSRWAIRAPSRRKARQQATAWRPWAYECFRATGDQLSVCLEVTKGGARRAARGTLLPDEYANVRASCEVGGPNDYHVRLNDIPCPHGFGAVLFPDDFPTSRTRDLWDMTPGLYVATWTVIDAAYDLRHPFVIDLYGKLQRPPVRPWVRVKWRIRNLGRTLLEKPRLPHPDGRP